MRGATITKEYTALWTGWFLAVPLWREFHEPHELTWNVLLALFLIALPVSSLLGLRYLEANNVAVGEARFITTDRDKQ